MEYSVLHSVSRAHPQGSRTMAHAIPVPSECMSEAPCVGSYSGGVQFACDVPCTKYGRLGTEYGVQLGKL